MWQLQSVVLEGSLNLLVEEVIKAQLINLLLASKIALALK